MKESRSSLKSVAASSGLLLTVLGLSVVEVRGLTAWGLPTAVLGLALWAWMSGLHGRLRWLAPALAVLAWSWALIGGPGEPVGEHWRRQVSDSYVDLWKDLELAADRTARAIERLQSPASDLDEPTDELLHRLFVELAQEVNGETLLLVRNGGQIVAWAGPALPMDVGGEAGSLAAALPTRGGPRAFVRPASATLTISEPLTGDSWRGWLIAAGRTFDATHLPWDPAVHVRWSIDEGGGPSAGVLPLDGGEWPDLWIAQEDLAGLQARTPTLAVWLALVALLAAVVVVLTSSTSRSGERWFAAVSVGAGLLAVGPPPIWVPVFCLLAGLGAHLSVRRLVNAPVSPRLRRLGLLTVLLVGGALAALTASSVVLVGSQGAPMVRFAGLRGIDHGTWLLLALIAGVAWILLHLRRQDRSRRLPAWAAIAILLLCLAAAATIDHPLPVGVVCLGILFLTGRHREAFSDAVLLLLSATFLATIWTASEQLTLAQAAYRQREQASLQSIEERRNLRREIVGSLDGRDVLSLSLGQTSLGSIESLAYGLWLDSPLDRRGLASVLAVTSEGAPLSTYEAGLGRNNLRQNEAGADEALEGGRPLLAPANDNPEPVERASGTLLFNGSYFADLEFAWQASPGLRWLDTTRLTPPLRVDPAAGPAPRLRASPGPFGNAFSLLSADGHYRLSLPPLGPFASLERVAGRAALALGVVGLLLALAHSGLVPGRWMQRLDALRRSYPRRLALTLGALILLPLLLVNLAILTLHERDLRAERERIEQAALDSARQAIYTRLDSLPPNFALNTALNDDVLAGFASIVGRPVDLYWNSGLYASSRRNRFDSQEFGGRLPAHVYDELVLGEAIQARHDATAVGGEVAVFASLERFDSESGPNLILAVPVAGPVDELTQAARDLRSRTLLIGFAVLALAFWATARAARNFSRPILDMIRGTERIASGADSLGIELPREQDLGRLATAIDRMAADVSALQRRERIERDLVEQILANVTTGVVLVDDDGRVSRANPVAVELLGVEVGGLLPEELDDPLTDLEAFRAPSVESGASNEKVTLEIDGESRQWQVTRIPVESPAGGAWLLVVEDVTEVVRGERLAAWAEMARIIAHEIKNPLTPIRLSAEHLREVFRPLQDPVQTAAVDRCTSNILEQVEDLRQIANEFSDYSRIPEIQAEPFVVTEWIAEVVGSYQPDDSDRRIEAVVDLDSALTIDADRRLLTRVLRNLLENSLRASTEAGVSIEAGIVADAKLQVAILDRGPGVAEKDLDRIFEPYFSTHETGTGLGLPISRRIVEAHGGSIQAHQREGGGLNVTMQIPLEPEGPLAS